METLKPNQQRAKNAVILLWITFAFLVVDVLGTYYQYSLLLEIDRGGNYSDETIRKNDLFQQVWGILGILVTITTATVFIQWFRRAYYNLHVLMNNLSFSEGWAAGFWFIPVANLFQPYKIMKELYTASLRLISNHREDGDRNYPRTLLICWWLLWVIGSITGNLAARKSWKADTIEEILDVTQYSLMSVVILVPASLLAIMVVKRYARLEDELLLIDQEETGDLSRHLATDNIQAN